MNLRGEGLPGLSVRRPVLALVLNLLIVLAGVAAYFGIEVRELPNVDRPVVSVTAQFPGASPETVDTEVTSVIEGAVARVSGVYAIRASSEENNMRLRAEFAPGADLDTAASDIREAVNRASRQLPDAVEQLTVVKADQDASPIVRVAASSATLSREELTRVVERDVVPRLIALSGVADVPLFGERQRLLRVVIDPMRLASFGLSVGDIAAVLDDAPFDVPAGSFRDNDMELLVRAEASAISEDAIKRIVVSGNTRIGDVAQVFFGPQDAESYVRLDGQPVIGLGVVRQAGSNTVEISEGVRAAVQQLDDRLDNVSLTVTFDAATFIRGSINEVVTTLLLAAAIVIAVIWLFLARWRVTLIPAVVMPVALIGTLGAIWLLGYSVNILTLLALVLATGLIVDDAIVVLENVQRRRAEGLGARAAAVLGTRQVFFAVIATTAVLVAVFMPIAFLPGTAGQLFREFGVLLAVAVMISSFAALSLVPMMSARLPAMREGEGNAGWRGAVGAKLSGFYRRSLTVVLAHPLLTLLLALTVAGGSAWTYQALEKQLMPDEDRGVLYVNSTGPDGVSLAYTERQARRVETILQPLVDSGEVQSLYTIVGRYDLNRAQVTAPLADWSERDRSLQEIANSLRDDLRDVPGSRVSTWSPNSLNLRGAGDGLEYALIGDSYDTLYAAAREFQAAVDNELAGLSDTSISYQPTQPELSLSIDRRRAADLGIDLNNLADTLRVMVDGDERVDLNVDDQAVPILIESAAGRIQSPQDLFNLHVRAAGGALVPLSSVVSLSESGVAAELDRHAQRRAIELDSARAPGTTLQEAANAVQALADERLPEGVTLILLGEAKALGETSGQVAVVYVIAIAMVFLVLAAQFESWTSPLVVVCTVPFALAAAIYALGLSGTSVNVYSQIGLVMLIGLMAKNGILLVEFADQLRDQGKSVADAVAEAASVRLRPIMMTLMSTMLAGLPLVLSDGPGAEARMAIGWVIFGGLGLAALFTLYLTPVLYLKLAGFSRARADEARLLAQELEAAEGHAPR